MNYLNKFLKNKSILNDEGVRSHEVDSSGVKQELITEDFEI